MSQPSKNLAGFRETNLRTWLLTPEEKVELVVLCFADSGVSAELNLHQDQLVKLAGDLSNSYNDVHFHSWSHAVDVFHTCYHFLVRTKCGELLSWNAKFALLVSALCHDMFHPGLTNAYQKKVESDLYKKFGEFSTLENLHASSAKDLLSLEGSLILNMSEENKCKISRWIKEAILATDLAAAHVSSMDALKAILPLPTQPDAVQELHGMDSSQCTLVNFVLKCADVSTVVKTTDVAIEWAKILQREFFHQGDLERERKIVMSFGMDRESSSDCNLPASQIGFYGFIRPLWELGASAIEGFDHFLNQMDANLTYWKERKAEESVSQA